VEGSDSMWLTDHLTRAKFVANGILFLLHGSGIIIDGSQAIVQVV
jgi:hypothetical protein